MDFYVARQPIFDRDMRVFGYEMLYRGSIANRCDCRDSAVAGSSVILHSFFSSLGAEDLLDGKRAFLNLDRTLLLQQSALLLPSDRVVIEVLENVEPDQEVLAACATLKQRGYLLALDDFVYSPAYDSLLAMADIVKVDVLASDLDTQRRVIERCRPLGIRLLAEKVETQEGFDEARRLGYTYYQGYFFARPTMMQGKDVQGLKPVYLRIVKEMQQPQLNLAALEQVMKGDLSLTYRLFRYLSSPLFGFRSAVDSLSDAFVLLGEENLRKWLMLTVLSGLASDKPMELMTNTLLRAFFCEGIATAAGFDHGRSKFFLTGLFSRLDAFLDCPMEEALAQVGLPEEIHAALSTECSCTLGTVLCLVSAWERSDWEAVEKYAAECGLKTDLADLYLAALRSCHEVFSTI